MATVARVAEPDHVGDMPRARWIPRLRHCSRGMVEQTPHSPNSCHLSSPPGKVSVVEAQFSFLTREARLVTCSPYSTQVVSAKCYKFVRTASRNYNYYTGRSSAARGRQMSHAYGIGGRPSLPCKNMRFLEVSPLALALQTRTAL